MDIVNISINAIKFDDITVTFQPTKLKKPIIDVIDTKHVSRGKITHLIFLKTNHKVKIINIKTPIPKTKISFLINEIISSAIIGIPLSLISALDLYFDKSFFIDLLYLLILLDCCF